MHEHVGLGFPSTSSTVEENKLLAEVERIVVDTSSKLRQEDGDAALGRSRQGRRHPLLIAGLALVVALVPAALKRGDLPAKVTHQASRD